MQRRSFLTLLASGPALAQLLAACGDDEQSVGDGAADASSLRSNAARITEGLDPGAAAQAVNALGTDLYGALASADPTANLAFSPASIAVALAMTAAGAQGGTLDEMAAVLHAGEPAGLASFHRSMNGLIAALAVVTRNEQDGMGGEFSVRLDLTNSVWGQADLSYEQPFLDLLAAEYGAGMELVDYVSEPEAARQRINRWVSDATEQRVTELIPEGSVTVDTRLTLVNAIYLKAMWAMAFEPALTQDEPFTTATGETVTVPMMHQVAVLPYAEGPTWQAVDLPYVFGDLSLTLVLAEGDAPPVAEVVDTLTERGVEVGVPRFDIGSTTKLNQLLIDLGMPTAFEPGRADFAGMTTEATLYIDQVLHQANLTVDERGTEAAAATAVVMVTESAGPTAELTLTFDRPFTFWLRHRSTGAALFMGRVVDPTAARA